MSNGGDCRTAPATPGLLKRCYPVSFLILEIYGSTRSLQISLQHIVPFGKFHRIDGAPPETLPNVKYDAAEEVGGDKK